MPNLLTIPNEILDEIVSNLDALATSYLLLSCRSLATLVKPAMLLHAVAPKCNEPALHWASRKAHLPLIQFLLIRFPVDLEKDDRSTPLQAASWSCSNNLAVEYLLLHGQPSTTPTVSGSQHSTTRAGARWKTKPSRNLWFGS